MEWKLFIRKLACFLFLLAGAIQMNAQSPRLVLPVGHSEYVKLTKFSPGEKYVLTASYDGSLKLWDKMTGRLLNTYQGHRGGVTDATFNKEGNLIASASEDSTAIVWETVSGKQLFRLSGHQSCVRKVVFNHLSTELLTTSADRMVKKWDLQAGALLEDITGATGIREAFYSDDGQYTVFNQVSNSIGICTEKNGEVNCSLLSGHVEPVTSILFLKDGTGIITASVDSAVITWDLQGQIKRTIKFDYPIGELQLSADQKKLLLIADNAPYAEVRLLKDTTVLATFGENSNNYTNRIKAGFSPDGKSLFVSADNMDSSYVYSVADKLTYKNGFLTRHGKISHLNFSGQGSHFILCWNPNKNPEMWQTEKSNPVASFKGYTHDIRSIQSVLNDSFTLASSAYNQVELWDNRKNALVYSLRSKMSEIAHVTVSPSEEKIATLDQDNHLQIWDTRSGELLNRLPIGRMNQEGGIQQIPLWVDEGSGRGRPALRTTFEKTIHSFSKGLFSPDEKFFATASNQTDGVALWDLASMGLKQNLVLGVNGILDIAFSSNSDQLIAGGRNAAAAILKIKENKIIELQGHNGNIKNVGFNSLGTVALTGSYDSTIKTWDVTTGQVLHTIRVGEPVLYADFSPDDRHIVALTNQHFRAWDAKTFQQKLAVNPRQKSVHQLHFLRNSPKVLLTFYDMVAPVVYDLTTGEKEDIYPATVNGYVAVSGNDSIITAAFGNKISKWNAHTGKLISTFFAVGSSDYFSQIPSTYYNCSPDAAKLLHYVTPDLKVIAFEQLDVKYNRPDLVLQTIGNRDTALIRSYRKAYEKRIKKLGIDTTAFDERFGLPEADFSNRAKISYEQSSRQLKLHIKGHDKNYLLDRYNVWVNETPIFGLKGLSLKSKKSRTLDTTVTITLSKGINLIETSVTNVNGTESYRMPLTVSYTPVVHEKEKLYFIGIGIDRFKDDRHNLNYSVKDVRDLALHLKNKYKDNISIDTLFNEKVNASNVAAMKKKLHSTSVNDKVILSYSGHGLLSEDFDYYLSTYSVNFQKPEEAGLPYDALEALLDSIPARKKLMLIDACHSGEVDKEEMQKYRTVVKEKAGEGLKGLGVENTDSTAKVGMKNSFELMQELFVNIGRSTGATIISAAAGTQLAQERGDLKNGVFTYAILEYMKKNPSSAVTELKQYVNRRVPELTNGLQVPTTRNETKQADWQVW